MGVDGGGRGGGGGGADSQVHWAGPHAPQVGQSVEEDMASTDILLLDT